MAKQTKQQIIETLESRVRSLEHEARLERFRGEQILNARYEAAQSYESSMNHWAKADLWSPDSANSPEVRAKLRSRSRFECVENNPYLNGIIQTLANDMAGSGVRLRIMDPDIPSEKRQRIEKRFRQWQKSIALREILWRMRVDKIVNGEAFAVAIQNPHLDHPVKLDWRVIEADCVTDPAERSTVQKKIDFGGVDGIRFDRLGYPSAYFIWNRHPGDRVFGISRNEKEGEWIPARYVAHWFKAIRGWNRGIPELTPSIPLCAVARRYTFALVKCMELQACLASVLESETPAGYLPNTEKEPFFDKMAIEAGMFNILPYGMKMKNFDRVPAGQSYDEFMGSLLREIVRPLLVPFNMQIGSSKDSNMASGVLDAGIYTNGQKTERYRCEETVLRKFIREWYTLGALTPGYFADGVLPASERNVPEYSLQWDKVTLEHTDPTKIINALAKAKEMKLMPDRDIQEVGFNKDFDEYRADVLDDAEFWKQLGLGANGAPVQPSSVSIPEDGGPATDSDDGNDTEDAENEQ